MTILIYILLFLVFMFPFLWFYRKYKEKKVEKIIPVLKVDISDFLQEKSLYDIALERWFYITKYQKEKTYSLLSEIEMRVNDLKKDFTYISDTQVLEWIKNFFIFYENFIKIVENINKNYYDKKLQDVGYLFHSLEKYPLDLYQQKAIVTPEKNLLVIAGAGSWKTSTIVWKVQYLTKSLWVHPSEILLISFTSASAKEMNERIEQKLWLSLDVKTFHKLWLDIIKQNGWIKQSIIENNNISDFKTYLSLELIPDIIQKSSELFIDFFHYLLKDNSYDFQFESMESFENYKKWSSNEIQDFSHMSFLWEKLKSNQEVQIANFLFLHGVSYKYEANYAIETANEEYRQYKPDFYLPDYDVYIEHFWIDKNGNVAWFFWSGSKESYQEENQKYSDWMQWKMKLHKENNTKLITTYSYQVFDGNLINELKSQLIKLNIPLKPISKQEIQEKISNKIKTETSIFSTLVLTFLNLYKSNNSDFSELENKQNNIFTTGYKLKKSWIFLKIFKIIFDRYEQFLSENNAIDFHDMINKATEYITSGKVHVPYKYVIIDEFQDIGTGRYKLIKSILESNNAELFCVWDDWQSIYRFSGWDLNIFTKFENFFPYWEKIFINKTYRYPQKVNEVTRNFIMKNKAQINKILESWNLSPQSDVYEIIFYQNEAHKKEILKTLRKQHENIIWIWRTKSDGNICKWIIDYKTVHSAKWLEEDYVVLVNGNSGTTGFPVEIQDSFLLDLVLSESDNFDYSEERRLFYVALTRARNKTFVLTQIWKTSTFVQELANILWVSCTAEKCPKCEAWYIVEKDHYKKWALWCSAYPKCDFTILTFMPFWKHKWTAFSQLPKDYISWMKSTFSQEEHKEVLESIHYEENKVNKKDTIK